MKKIRMIFAVVLTLCVLVTALVMSASAADNEVEVMPCIRVGICPVCNGSITTYENRRDNGIFDVASCPNFTESHQHHSYRISDVTECEDCGFSREMNVYYMEVCLGERG